MPRVCVPKCWMVQIVARGMELLRISFYAKNALFSTEEDVNISTSIVRQRLTLSRTPWAGSHVLMFWDHSTVVCPCQEQYNRDRGGNRQQMDMLPSTSPTSHQSRQIRRGKGTGGDEAGPFGYQCQRRRISCPAVRGVKPSAAISGCVATDSSQYLRKVLTQKVLARVWGNSEAGFQVELPAAYRECAVRP